MGYNWNPVDDGTQRDANEEEDVHSSPQSETEEDTPTGWVKYRNSSNHVLLVRVEDEGEEVEWDEIEVEETIEETIEITDKEELEKIYQQEKKAAKAKLREERRRLREKEKENRKRKKRAEFVANRRERYEKLVEKS